MKNYIIRPSIDLYPGVRVNSETELEYETENVKQEIKDLVLHSVTRIKGEGFEGVNETTVQLQEGDILIFEPNGRGYIKPVQAVVSIEEAISDLENIKDLGGE